MKRTTWAALAVLVGTLAAISHVGFSIYDAEEGKRVRFRLTADFEREHVCRAGTLEEAERCRGGDKLYFWSTGADDRIVTEVTATQCAVRYPIVKWTAGVVCTKNAGHDEYQGYRTK